MTRDTTVQDAAPIECYKFISPIGTYRFTSHPRRVNMAGEWYESFQVTRSNSIEVSSVIDNPVTMDFNLPADHALAVAYCYEEALDTLTVEVRRGHYGDDLSTEFTVEWVGEWSGSSVNGMWATFKTASVLNTKLGGNTSSVYYQRVCNHILFDERCKVVREEFTVSAYVEKIQGQLITVDDDQAVNGYYNGGELVNTRTGETKSIVINTDDVVTINSRFYDLVVGDVVELTPGCDHVRLQDCKNKYDNVVNYGGFDFIPTYNPFTDLPTQSWVETEVRTQKIDEITKVTFSSPGSTS